MAKVVAEFDTVTKQGSVSIDGSPISDVAQFELYGQGAGRYCMEVYSRTEDRANGTTMVTRVCAAKDGSLVRAEAVEQLPAGTVAEAAPPELTPELLKAVAARLNGKGRSG